MAFSYRDTEIVKGMLERGDRQHDIAAYFADNGGRVAEVSKGEGTYPEAKARDAGTLPPPGPYLCRYPVLAVVETLNEAMEAIELAAETENTKDAKAALELAKETLLQKVEELEDL